MNIVFVVLSFYKNCVVSDLNKYNFSTFFFFNIQQLYLMQQIYYRKQNKVFIFQTNLYLITED